MMENYETTVTLNHVEVDLIREALKRYHGDEVTTNVVKAIYDRLSNLTFERMEK